MLIRPVSLVHLGVTILPRYRRLIKILGLNHQPLRPKRTIHY
jgi:hypothetical protein